MGERPDGVWADIAWDCGPDHRVTDAFFARMLLYAGPAVLMKRHRRWHRVKNRRLKHRMRARRLRKR